MKTMCKFKSIPIEIPEVHYSRHLQDESKICIYAKVLN